MRTKPLQLSVMAVAFLAVVAVAAVMLLSSGNPAQADTAATIAPDNGGNLSPLPQKKKATPTPAPTRAPRVHATPEPCPGETGNDNATADVVDSGHIALFDVWWNPDEGELTNTSCPPTVAHAGGSDTRSPSSINIAKTVIHIPNSTKIDLSTSTTYTRTNYPELWAADDAENRDINNDGTFDGVGDRQVWALPACPPDGTPATNGLCLSFSAVLLDPADWTRDPDAAADAPATIEYHIDHVHQIDIDKQDPRYTLAYDAPAATGKNDALWSSHNARVAVMPVAPGEYERPTWFFTSRGTYELQVHIRGNPEQSAGALGGLDPLGKEPSVTSDVREYIIHVGAEADLGVGVTATPESVSPTNDVTITVTASNAGPETAPDNKVDVTLPEGLTYSSHTPTGATFTDGDGDGIRTWEAGSLTSGSSQTLTITARVDPNTRGKDLSVEATISGTETVVITETDENGVDTEVEYDVPVADPNSGNNTRVTTIVVVPIRNVDPIFRVEATVAENSPAGTAVFGPPLVRDPNDTSHKFGLEGEGKGRFHVNEDTGIVTVAQGANLDYECRPKYKLTLTVSDGKNELGNSDTGADDELGLDVALSDVDDDVTVTIASDHSTLEVGNSIRLTATPSKGAPCGEWVAFQWREKDPPTDESWAYTGGLSLETVYYHTTPGTRAYQLALAYEDANRVRHSYLSNIIEVTWTDPDPNS